VEYKALPYPVRIQVDSLTFQGAIQFDDSLYSVETGNKKRWTEVVYKYDGEIICSHERNNKVSIFGTVGFIGIATYMSLLILGYTQ
jgi:hypothetical protein